MWLNDSFKYHSQITTTSIPKKSKVSKKTRKKSKVKQDEAVAKGN